MPKLMKLSVDEGGIAHLVLDNPDERMNVISALFFEEFISALDAVEKDGKVKGLIIESSKPGVFVAGADIKWLKDLKTPEQCTDFAMKAHIPSTAWKTLNCPRLRRSAASAWEAALNSPWLAGGGWRLTTSPCR